MSIMFQGLHNKTNPLERVSTTPHPTSRPHPRTRTSSFLSISSTASTKSAFEILSSSLALVREPVKCEDDSRAAYGSFIPVRSAASTLNKFVSISSPPVTRISPKRKRVTFVDPLSTSPQRWPEDEDIEPPFQVPFITRTLPPTPECPPSPISSTSSIIIPHQQSSNPDLHPILARLEKKSKFCTQKSQCATCHKTGSDFPRCGKCDQSWCSRQCRLVGGKRHVCPS